MITFTAPAHAAGTVTITVRVSGAPSAGLSYQYGTVTTVPGTKPSNPLPGSPSPHPPTQPPGTQGGSPSPLPNPRP